MLNATQQPSPRHPRRRHAAPARLQFLQHHCGLVRVANVPGGRCWRCSREPGRAGITWNIGQQVTQRGPRPC